MAIHIIVTRPGELAAKGTFLVAMSPNEVMRLIHKAIGAAVDTKEGKK